MNIALVSLDQVWEDKTANLTLCEKYIKDTAQKKVELIVFPEMTLTGFSTHIKSIAENENDSFTIKSFKELAKQYRIAILFGMVIADKEKALNKSFFINSEGKILSQYSKIHPFSFAGEDKYYNPGSTLSIVNFNEHRIGLSICYDLRFPELYSALSKECDIIFNIANWPKKRVDHWNTLLKARAIENQVFIAGINRTGIDGNGLEYEESSNIYNANGKLLEYTQLENMKIFQLSKDWTENFKKQFITVKDRKTSLYKEIL
jgi:omega-amidase